MRLVASQRTDVKQAARGENEMFTCVLCHAIHLIYENGQNFYAQIYLRIKVKCSAK